MPALFLGKRQWIVWFCFFFSGISALIYEVVWVRQFELVFGVGTYAVGAVLTAFMGGLSLGSWVGGRWADRTPYPLKLYGILELLIGFYALLFPLFFQLVNGAYLLVETRLDLPAFLSLLLRFIGAVFLLVTPTFFMGATLPFLSKTVTDSVEKAGLKVGRLYGVNTVGAVLGVLLSGFLLIPRIGQLRTTLLAACLNLTLGMIVLWISRGAFPGKKFFSSPGSKEVKTYLDAGRLALLIAALSGFSAMVYETCYTRILTMTLGGSVYAFSTMLATFLAGLSLGALAVSGSGFLKQKPKTSLIAVLGCAGVAALLTGFFFDRLGYFFFWLCQIAVSVGFDFNHSQRPVQFFVSASVMMPTALLLGAAFPLILKMGSPPLQKMGNWVGKVYAWNTLGAILGSFSAAFLMIPFWGIQMTLMAGVYFHLAAAMVLMVYVFETGISWRFPVLGGLMGAVLLLFSLLPSWNHHRMAIGPYVQVRTLEPGTGIIQAVNARVEATDLLFYREGVATTVTVERNRARGTLFLSNNGKPEASTLSDLPTQQLISHLPLLWFECSRGRPARQAALIGLASGISAGAALQHSLDRLTVVELEPFMPQAAGIFKDYNYNVLSDARFHFVGDDGRHYLKIHPGQFDVIISEPSNPWISGVSNLFTRESFAAAREALAEGGVFCQWVQVYEMKLENLKTIVRTFHSVFPYTTLFGVPPRPGEKSPAPDLILLGSSQPVLPEVGIMDRVVRENRLQAALKRIGIRESGDLVSLLRVGPEDIGKFQDEGQLNLDDNALIEFSAPLNLYRDTYFEDLMEIRKFQDDPLKYVTIKSPKELKKILLRISSDLYPYWRRDLAVQWRRRAEHL